MTDAPVIFTLAELPPGVSSLRVSCSLKGNRRLVVRADCRLNADTASPSATGSAPRLLTQGEAAEIRKRFADGESTAELAARFGVNRRRVQRLVRNETYREASA